MLKVIHYTFNTKYKLILLKAEEKNNMKKSIIAGAGVAALGFAALPFAGVFAASDQLVDTLDVNVQGGCTMEDSTHTTPGDFSNNSRSFSKDMTAGTVGYLNADEDGNVNTGQDAATSMKITCNEPAGSVKTWTVSASVTNSGNLKNGESNIVPGTDTNGNTSMWAVKANAANANTSTYDNYAGITGGTAATFLTGSATSTTSTFIPSYQVYVAPTATQGHYTGTVTYTVSLSNS